MGRSITDLPRKPRYGIDEAAYILCVSPRTVRRLIEYGRLPAAKIGGQVRISMEELDQFIENSKIDPFK